MPFKPGVSGNPAGRPAGGLSLAARIRTLGGEDGATYAEALHSIATDDDQPTRLRIDAIKVLLDRGYGRLPQEIEVQAPAELMRASELRKALKDQGLLDGPREQASNSVQLQRWVAGVRRSLDDGRRLILVGAGGFKVNFVSFLHGKANTT